MSIEIIFIQSDGTEHIVHAEPAGTLMEVARSHGLPGIDAECGGNCICATCHVYIDEPWGERIAAASSGEKELLEFVLERKPTSRLSCQLSLTPALDGLVVGLPKTLY